MSIFEIVWTDYTLEKKYIIGRLVHDKQYIFKYNQNQINEAIENGFIPFVEFPNIETTYFSKELFQTFAIRLSNTNSDEIGHNLDNGAELSTDRIKIYCRTGVNKKWNEEI